MTNINPTNTVLVIDLDHTLIHTDMMIESIKWLARHKPHKIPLIAFWLIKGKAYVKHRLLENIQFKVADLSYNQTVIDYIKQRKQSGDTIVLATASAQYYANKVAQHLGLFDKAYGSSQTYNLSGQNKADFLVKQYGKHHFDYAGDHRRDMPVWAVSNLSIIINAKQKLKKQTNLFKTHHLIG